MVHKYFFILLLICSTLQDYIPIYDLIGNISSLKIEKEEDYYKSVINNTIEMMNNYAYINILKSPPKINGSDYFPKVDIIKDLENLRETKIKNFYEFYQQIKKIIDSAKDYHIYFGYFGQEEPFNLLTKLFVCVPIEFQFLRNKDVLVKVNSIISSLSKGTVQVKNQEKINNNYNNNITVEKINGIDVYSFIRNYCSDFIQFKSKSAKFVWNRENMRITQLWQCPLNPEEFSNFDITYSNGETISSNYIGFYNNAANLNIEQNIFNPKFNTFENNQICSKESFKPENANNAIDWDINIDNKIKCKVDHINEVNVIYQNSFSPDNSDPIGIINKISYCHGNFSNNDYPLIVIESLNGGGFAQLSKLMQQLVQDLMLPKNYFSVIHNDNTKQFLRDNRDSFLFVDDNELKNLSINEFYEDKIREQYDKDGEVIIERSKQRLLVDLNFESLIRKNIFKRNKIKKPTDVIVFTDGLSFSSTSIFIKNLYYFGGAILVGYGGDPEEDIFDASQSPTFVLTNLTGIKGYFDLRAKGFLFLQIPAGPMYRNKHNETTEEIPEEFTINNIDERINLYNAYNDNLYQDFVNEAKIIFEKYKRECNINNKYLKLLNENCTFSDAHTHGGYICGEDGNWTTECAPFYCDEDYYFDYNTHECIFTNNKKSIYVDSIYKISLEYLNYSILKFVPDDINNDIRVNIHSINCKIKIDFENSDSNDYIINQMNNDTFSFLVNKTEIKNIGIIITPLIYSIDERIKENYKDKTCPIMFTNYQVENNENIPSLELTDSSNLYFNENNTKIQFIYKINYADLDTPIALSLNLNKNSKFIINITKSGNETFIINKEIFNSTNIFLGKGDFKEKEQLIIQIESISISPPVFVNIKMIKKTSVSILDQNNLNFGFITSNIEYQYYYMEVFKDQEGEIMIHNKRQKGILIADLKKKSQIMDLNVIANYPNKSTKTNLEYNPHYLKLSFNYEQTAKCENGCYLLLTYYKEVYDSSDVNDAIIGYEYTIFSRIWDCMEFSSQIINIPFNEYIFGSFDKDSITHHYYSIFIPNDVDKIIIQLEGNYLDVFVGKGIVKLNTMKTLKNVLNLNLTNNQNFIELTKEELNFELNNIYMSLAFRSKNFFEDIFSFYYYRIFFVKGDKNLYFPVDSNFGNLCLPSNEKESGLYYCNLILKNDYNELSSNFSIADGNQIEYSYVHVTTFYKNSTNISKNSSLFKFVFTTNDDYENISHFIFRFEFEENGIKNIISAFSSKIRENSPQIYSSEMYYIYDRTIYFNYSLKDNYLFTTKYIGGENCFMKLNYSIEVINLSRNFRGKPVSIQISPGTEQMTYWAWKADFIFYLKIEYNMKNKGIEEIVPGEIKSHIINNGYFPLYYYLNLTKKENVSTDISIRLNSYNLSELKNDFEIKGYIVDEKIIKSKIKGEHIELNEKEAIQGTFMECYKLGILEIKRDIINKNDFVLISITNKVEVAFHSNLLVEILYNEYKSRYFMPISQYIIETFNKTDNLFRDENEYTIAINDKDNNDILDSVLVEFSPNYEHLILYFENITFNYTHSNFSGFQKFRITGKTPDIIHFKVKNLSNKTNANYILKYYYTYEKEEYRYKIDNFTYHSDKTNQNYNININFNLGVFQYNALVPIEDNVKIIFDIHAFLFDNTINEDELLNCSTIIYRKSYENKIEKETIYNDSNTYNSLTFQNVEFKSEYILQLRVNVFINRTIFNEEFLTYSFKINLPSEDDDNNNLQLWIWIIIGFAIVILFVVIYLLIRNFRKLKKDNKNLKEQVLSIGYSAGIEKSILMKEEMTKKDDDYENTFI